MTNTLLASVTNVTDGTAAVSAADRNFYPEYGITQFKTTSIGNYAPYSGDLSLHDVGESLFSSGSMPGSIGQTMFNGGISSPTSVFAQPSGSAFGNYSNTVTLYR